MDTSGFFDYPTLPARVSAPAAGFLPGASEQDWEAVLGATETLRFSSGDEVLRAGDPDRAFYLLLDGRLEVAGTGAAVRAPALVGVAAFFDGSPRAVTLIGRTHGELARMGWDAFEALAARDPRLGRVVLADLGRELAARLRDGGRGLSEWTG